MDLPREIEYAWGYYEIQTNSFFCRVYKRSGSNRTGKTFRAEITVKAGDRKYCIAWELFHGWDFQDDMAAFSAAIGWVREKLADVAKEVFEILPTEATKMK